MSPLGPLWGNKEVEVVDPSKFVEAPPRWTPAVPREVEPAPMPAPKPAPKPAPVRQPAPQEPPFYDPNDVCGIYPSEGSYAGSSGSRRMHEAKWREERARSDAQGRQELGSCLTSLFIAAVFVIMILWMMIYSGMV